MGLRQRTLGWSITQQLWPNPEATLLRRSVSSRGLGILTRLVGCDVPYAPDALGAVDYDPNRSIIES